MASPQHSVLPLAFLMSVLCVHAVVPMMSPEPMVSPMVMTLPPGTPIVTPGPFDPAFVETGAATNATASIWPNAYFRGTPNDFLFTPMMYEGGLWKINATFGTSSSERFKIARFMDWTEAYPANDYYVTQGAGAYEITFDEVTKGITVTKIDGNVDIQFQCDRGLTFLGQSVYATGNITELGNWNLANAVPLSAATYPSWRRTVPVGIGKAVEWKCVKRLEADPSMNVEYEPGANNQFTASVPTSVFGSF